MRKRELKALLREYQIPFEQWGTGNAKTFDDFFLEVSKGEAILRERAGTLIRIIEVSTLAVYYNDGENVWVLCEDRQLFVDGRTRFRTRADLGEKLRLDESPLEGAHRALREELGITEKLPLLSKPPPDRDLAPSTSYPGLCTSITLYCFEVFLPAHWYKPEGYIEVQPTKTIYFGWRRI